jgi:hypothetical protein
MPYRERLVSSWDSPLMLNKAIHIAIAKEGIPINISVTGIRLKLKERGRKILWCHPSTDIWYTTIQEVADDLNVSLSTIHRYYKGVNSAATEKRKAVVVKPRKEYKYIVIKETDNKVLEKLRIKDINC